MRRRVTFCACLAGILLVAMAPLGRSQAKDGARVGLLSWPSSVDSSGAGRAAISEMEGCLASHIQEAAPELVVVGEGTVRDVLYPLLEPSTEPQTEAGFAALLAREDVHARLAQRGLRYLVALSSSTARAKPGGFMLCGASQGGGGCLGFSWEGESAAVDAALWSLADGASVRSREGAEAEGRNVFPAFIVPVRIPARTMTTACRKLAPRIAASIREAERPRSLGR